MRVEAKARRKEITPQRAQQAALALRDRVLASGLIGHGAAVSGYWPIGDEIDPRPLMQALAARGHELCLPVVIAGGQPLLFRRWRAGDELVAAGFETFVPGPAAAPMQPDVLLVPLLAFDRNLYRLGYGAGYYDRTIAVVRSEARSRTALGIAFALQEVAAVPTGPGDERLDAVATEREIVAPHGFV